MPDILAELASVEMHAIQTSGNCIRNVTADHFAGVADDEIADPRPYAEILRQWSSLHPEFSFLPRKFKIAVNGAAHDRAVIQVHDIGLQVVRNEAGGLGFTVYVGGGLGRTPLIGRKVREFLPERDLLGYIEAILRVYNLEGRRDNKYKARIKILMHEKSLETLREEIETEFAARDRKLLDLPPEEVARMRAFFAPPELERKKPVSDRVERRKGKDSRFASFLAANVRPHREPGYVVVTVSLKAIGAPPGDASADQMDAVADLAEDYSHDEVRVSHEQNLILPHVALDDLHGGLRPPGFGRPRDPERRLGQRHHRLPGPRLLRARHRALDSRSPSASRRNSATARAQRASVRSRSRSPAASTPAATTMSATSAFSASSAPARRPTRSRSAARATKTRRSARSSAPASARRMSSRRWRRSSRPTWA